MTPRTPKLATRPSRADFLVITGLSGAGKSQAIHAVEDLGYYCVDNLPVELLPELHALHRRDEALAKVAVVVDIREPRFLSAFPGVYARLRASADVVPSLIFLEASAAVLHRRFSETRRPHPLAPGEPIADAIARERRKMARIRAMADEIVDTSDLTVHELRQVFLGLSHGRKHRAALVLTFESFGFKYGLPLSADLVFDVRFLPNPHFVPGLRPQTGRDQPVAAFLDAQAARGAAALPDAAVRGGGEELPHGGDWLHGRAPSLGLHRRIAAPGAGQHQGRDDARAASRRRPRKDQPMIGVVVVTHGQLAAELVSAAETIVGDLPHVKAVSIGWHEDVQDARQEIAAAIAAVSGPEGVLIATDMFGGTPANLGITFLEAGKVEVVTGINLPMLIKLAGLRDTSSLLDAARQIREHGRNAIWVASDLLNGDTGGPQS
jgi:UPF0042 nucleotide-binding protein